MLPTNEGFLIYPENNQTKRQAWKAARKAGLKKTVFTDQSDAWQAAIEASKCGYSFIVTECLF